MISVFQEINHKTSFGELFGNSCDLLLNFVFGRLYIVYLYFGELFDDVTLLLKDWILSSWKIK